MTYITHNFSSCSSISMIIVWICIYWSHMMQNSFMPFIKDRSRKMMMYITHNFSSCSSISMIIVCICIYWSHMMQNSYMSFIKDRSRKMMMYITHNLSLIAFGLTNFYQQSHCLSLMTITCLPILVAWCVDQLLQLLEVSAHHRNPNQARCDGMCKSLPISLAQAHA